MKTVDPLFAAVQSFFTDYLQRARGCTPSTLASYRDTLRLFFEDVCATRATPIDRLQPSFPGTVSSVVVPLVLLFTT